MSGSQRLTNDGTLTPTGSPIRIYSIGLACSVSACNITLHNGAAASSTQYLRVDAVTNGTAQESWIGGMLFPDGVYIDTHAAGSVIALIGFNTEA